MYSRRQLKQEVVLKPADFVEIRKRRRSRNRFGFAYQLSFARLLNRFPRQRPFEILDELVTFTAVQLDLAPSLITSYRQRQQTVSEHQQQIAAYLKLRTLGESETVLLERFLFEQACHLERSATLEDRAQEFLKERHILRPGQSTILRVVGEQRRLAREHIFERIVSGLSFDLRRTLDDLLQVRETEKFSELQKIKANPSKPSVDGMLALLRKLAVIEKTGVLGVDLSWLNANYQRALFHQVRKSSTDRLRELTVARRHAVLVGFLRQSYRDAVDQVVDMFDKLLTRTETRARNELNEQMRRQRKAIRGSLVTLKTVGTVILDEGIADQQLREALFARIPREELISCIAGLDEWVSGKKSDLFHGVVRRHSMLRRFSPALLEALDLEPDREGEANPCLQALALLKEMNAAGRRKLPDDAPTDFVPKRLQPIVGVGQATDRRAWECALLLQVRDEIKSGNVTVRQSKRFASLDDFFVDSEHWNGMREQFFGRADLPVDGQAAVEHLTGRLGRAYDRFIASAPSNSYAVVDEKGWRLSADTPERRGPEAKQRMEQLKTWLSANMRRIMLPDLLIEVDNELAFTRHFATVAQPDDGMSPDDVCLILAAVMAHGCNIGPYTMAQLTPDVSYKQLKRVTDWQLTEEAQRLALAELVGAIADLDTSLYWGEGKTSASDGQRFSMRRKVLQQTYSPRFSDFALEFYTFVSDNYAPFYSTPIECTDRDAAFVLDGLLENESDLPLEEHYTDTHGYTEINFAAFAMLGRRFCPRIRGLHHQRIYRIDPDRDYGPLASLVGRNDRTIDMTLIAEQWDRMGQLYGSLQTGHVTASVALRRLVAFSPKNRFYRANRDLGRIFKTEFLLQYMAEPELRGRIRRGLLKVEQLHALARDVFYGRRGRINARELWEQMNGCSCLTLIVACIVYWQAHEISRAISDCDPEAAGVDLSLLERVSPIEWDNVVLYGQYVLDRKRIRRRRAKHLRLIPKSKPPKKPVDLGSREGPEC
jgi:TnpA family transposase/molybdopterin-guanine dinucleotide biosynthesis protein A